MVTEQSSRKVRKLLKEAGFIPDRTEGSHTFWKGPNGAQVVVPDGHKSISPGVVRQVLAAIKVSKGGDPD